MVNEVHHYDWLDIDGTAPNTEALIGHSMTVSTGHHIVWSGACSQSIRILTKIHDSSMFYKTLRLYTDQDLWRYSSFQKKKM